MFVYNCRYCCRRMLLGHVDLIEKLLNYAPLEKWFILYFFCIFSIIAKIHKYLSVNSIVQIFQYFILGIVRNILRLIMCYDPLLITLHYALQLRKTLSEAVPLVRHARQLHKGKIMSVAYFYQSNQYFMVQITNFRYVRLRSWLILALHETCYITILGTDHWSCNLVRRKW